MQRCPWAKTDLYIDYHDREWGVPLRDDRLLFEFLILEGAQAGLSWETILKKRQSYRTAFDQFDAKVIARYGAKKRTALLANPGIVRNRLKIASAIRNAQAFLAVQRGIRHVRRVHLELRRRQAQAECLEVDEGRAGHDAGIGQHEQGPEEAGIQFRRQHDLLCLHAGRGYGQRPSGRVFPTW